MDGWDAGKTRHDRPSKARAASGVIPPGDPIRARYEDRGPIARGGMGDVVRVYDRHLDRILAMKILSAELADDAASRARFLAEAKITAGLQHPGIVAVHDQGVLANGRLWFTMREIRGRTLAEVIDALHAAVVDGGWPQEAGLSLFRVVDSFRRICDAVAYAHDRGVVHRDLKPSNLMVGEFGEVQVMDWGLAKPVSDTARESVRPLDGSLTQVGDVVGTPSYMSPEQARGEPGELGPRSDVWALGAVLRTILTNRPPVEGPSPVVLATILMGEIKPIASVVDVDHPPIPEELVAICERAMATAVGERYADAGELGADVGAWLEGARRRRSALRIVSQADALEPAIRALREEASGLRERARTLLGALAPNAPAEEKYEGWETEDRAQALEREAALREVQWTQHLRSALNAVPDLPEAHARLAEHYRDALLAAEARRDPEAAARAEVLLRAHDRGAHAEFLAGDGAVTLVTDPPGARVTAYRYVERHRRLVPEHFRDLGRTPVMSAPLPHGSYLLIAELEGRPPVRYPVLIERGEHWDGIAPGDREPHPIPIPTADELGDDLVYVPAGWFWSGGDPRAVESLPRRRIWVDGLLVARHPVTNAEYIEFLDELVARGQEELALRFAPRFPADRDDEAVERLAFDRTSDGRFVLPQEESGARWDSDWPVSLIDWYSAVAYAEAFGARRGRRTARAWSMERRAPATHPAQDRSNEGRASAPRPARVSSNEELASSPLPLAGGAGGGFSASRSGDAGERFRLPNELEWEKFARGVDARAFAFGDQIDPSWACILGSRGGAVPGRASIDAYMGDESPFGVIGTSGNVREWCANAWRPEGPRITERRLGLLLPGREDGELRALRGGAWHALPELARAAGRFASEPHRRFSVAGLRIVVGYP